VRAIADVTRALILRFTCHFVDAVTTITIVLR